MPPANAIRNWSVVLPIRLVRGQAAAASISPVPANRNMFTTLPTVNRLGQYRVRAAEVNIRVVPVRPVSVRERMAVRNTMVRRVHQFAKKLIRTTATNVPTTIHLFTAV